MSGAVAAATGLNMSQELSRDGSSVYTPKWQSHQSTPQCHTPQEDGQSNKGGNKEVQ